ncbi:hypothetical protein ACTFIV_003371 [Dictyostelium citrinum]
MYARINEIPAVGDKLINFTLFSNNINSIPTIEKVTIIIGDGDGSDNISCIEPNYINHTMITCHIQPTNNETLNNIKNGEWYLSMLQPMVKVVDQKYSNI